MAVHFTTCIAAGLENARCACAARLAAERATLSGIADYLDLIADDMLREYMATCIECGRPRDVITHALFEGRQKGLRSRAATLRSINVPETIS